MITTYAWAGQDKAQECVGVVVKKNVIGDFVPFVSLGRRVNELITHKVLNKRVPLAKRKKPPMV